MTILYQMNFQTHASLSERQVRSGLQLIIKDGLTAEAMTTLTGGTFLMAMALLLGASNFQIGLLTALPTLTNVFQLISIWLVQKYNNRKAVMVICSFLARTPLFLIGLLPFLFSAGTSISVLIFLLSFHYFFGSIAGASWSSWMKDLVPVQVMGTYFSHRSRLMQTLNVVLSLFLALALDYTKSHYPQGETLAYAVMFIVGGIFGMLGVYALARTPEPASTLTKENLFVLFSKPLKDRNFRNLLVFHSSWAFALNLATPFLSVYMMKSMGLPLSYIIGLGILAQLSSIFSIKMWGRYTDRYSNKTIISIAGPVYIACILSLTFTALPAAGYLGLVLLALIQVVSGTATAAINLSINNVGMKLAPREEAIVYISARNIAVAFISALGPLCGGMLADFLATRSFTWSLQWPVSGGTEWIPVVHLQNWNFLFIIGGMLALLALRLLKKVNEEGEVEKEVVVGRMRLAMRNRIKDNTRKEVLLALLYFPVQYPVALKKKVQHRIEKRASVIRRLNSLQAARKRA